MDLRPHLDTGRLQVRADRASRAVAGRVRPLRPPARSRSMARRSIVIDSLNGYLHAMPNEQYLLLQMHELLSYLSQHGVVTLLILGQHGLVGEVRSDVDLSYLSDTIILMRFFEAAGEVRRILSVVKTRTSAHEPTIREFSLGPDGLTIGASPARLRRRPERHAHVPRQHRRADGDGAPSTRRTSAGRLRPTGVETASGTPRSRPGAARPRRRVGGRDPCQGRDDLPRLRRPCRPGASPGRGRGRRLGDRGSAGTAMTTKGVAALGGHAATLVRLSLRRAGRAARRHRARGAGAGVVRRDRQRRAARTAAWRRGPGERGACRPARAAASNTRCGPISLSASWPRRGCRR